jgi:hypothetical protein
MLAPGGRAAIYAAPHPDDPLWAFGSTTLGYDAARGALVSRPPPLRLTPERWDELTAEPRRYGFHATLKAPFRLSAGIGLKRLSEAISRFCEGRRAVAPFPLEVRAIGEFLALVPASAPEDLAPLAASVVTNFDGFRAGLSQAERERRLPAKLSARQAGYLERFGYPYVLEEFRFHMSLTGKVPDPILREELRLALAEGWHREAGGAPFGVDALVLFVQPAPEDRFLIRERHAFERPAS